MNTKISFNPSVLLAVLLLATTGFSPIVSAGVSLTPVPPTVDADKDDDGLLNGDETITGTDPANPDSDGDGIPDGVDPGSLAFVIQQLPGSAFKSKDDGHRSALLIQLETNERFLEAGDIDKAVRQLERIREHLDGCPSVPDKDDWIVDCDAQLSARRILDILLGNHVSFAIDTSMEPPVALIPGLNGDADRAVGMVTGTADKEPFVLNEVIVRSDNQAALDAFIQKYDGIVLRDGTPYLLPGTTPPPGLPATTGSYLLRINPALSGTQDLAVNMEHNGLRGAWRFSSADAARTAAIVARETDINVSLNFTMEMASHPVLEHPDDYGGNLDATKWWWMTEDDDPNQPGDQGLSTGVIHAWEYVQYKGYPPINTPYLPLRLAIIDNGFDLDETNGEPITGKNDFKNGFLQFDEIQLDGTAGGAGYGSPGCNGCWHGHLSYGTCCALSNNHYGTAGTSGGWNVEPILIKTNSDIDNVSNAIFSALYNWATVIHETLGFECGWWCRNFGGGDDLTSMVKLAKSRNTIFVTPAQNQGRDISNADLMPCNRNGAVCVGAIKRSGNAADYSNWGSIVDTWAPTDTLSIMTRDSAGWDPNDVGVDELFLYTGTSASTPYLTGIVALMKMVNPNLTYEQTRTILVSTANTSADPKVSSRGYVDAYRAVVAASPNLPPAIKIKMPTYGDKEPYTDIHFSADVADPEMPNPYGGRTDFISKVEFSSDKDGSLCSASGDISGNGATLGCDVAEMSIGGHLIKAVVTDPFGGSKTDFVNFEVINTPPVTSITYPADGATFYSNQQINFRGYAFDDEVYGYIPVSWTSSISGSLGSSEDFWTTLPTGTHVIALSATDEKGATSTDTVTIEVKAAGGGGGYPSVMILQPANGATFGVGDVITFKGQATDPEDGNITNDAAFSWSSSVDGNLGTGMTLQKTLSVSGESTNHVVTLEVTDSDGHKSSHAINVTILNPL